MRLHLTNLVHKAKHFNNGKLLRKYLLHNTDFQYNGVVKTFHMPLGGHLKKFDFVF